MFCTPQLFRSGFRLRGYTLIELLTVVAILGIAGSLLIPYLGNRDSLRVQSAVRLLIGDVSFAQSDALSHQEMRRVHFYDDGSGYCIVRLLNNTELAAAFDASTARYVNDPLTRSGSNGDYVVNFTSDNRWNDIRIIEVEIDGANRNLNFDTLGGTITTGQAPGTGGRIVIGKGADRYEVTIAPFTGKLSVREI